MPYATGYGGRLPTAEENRRTKMQQALIQKRAQQPQAAPQGQQAPEALSSGYVPGSALEDMKAKQSQMIAEREASRGPNLNDPRYASPELDTYLKQSLGGHYLDKENPYLADITGQITSQAQEAFKNMLGGINAQSLGPGRLGSSYYNAQVQNMAGDQAGQLSDALSRARFGVYGDERDRQNAAAGMAMNRDQGILADQTRRYTADQNLAAANAAGRGASIRANLDYNLQQQGMRNQAASDEARTRSNLLLGLGGLDEQARQFDANYGLRQTDQMLGGLGQFSGMSAQNNAMLANLLGMQQQGRQAGAGMMGNLGSQAANYGLQNQGQQMGMAQLLGGLSNADLASQGQAANYLADLYRTGAQSSSAGNALDFQRQMAQHNSALNQWGAMNPQNILGQQAGILAMLGGMGGNTFTEGVRPGNVVMPAPSSGLSGAQGAMGSIMGMLGMMGQGGFGGFGG